MNTPVSTPNQHYNQDAAFQRRIEYLRRSQRDAEAELEIEEHAREWQRRQTVTEKACRVVRTVREP